MFLRDAELFSHHFSNLLSNVISFFPPSFYGRIISNKEAVRNFKKKPGLATKSMLIAQFMVA